MKTKELRKACVKRIETIFSDAANAEFPLERLRGEQDICDIRIAFDAQTSRFNSVSLLLKRGEVFVRFFGEPKRRNEWFHDGVITVAKSKDGTFRPLLTTGRFADFENAYSFNPGHDFCAKINKYAEKIWNAI